MLIVFAVLLEVGLLKKLPKRQFCLFIVVFFVHL